MNTASSCRPRLLSITLGSALIAGAAFAPGSAALASSDTRASASTTGVALAPTDPCPAAYPVNQLTRGQVVDGLTVDEGTTPAPFSGEVIGTLRDGIAPGIEMIMVELSSPAIDEAGGVWSGMSGSPVYAEDGRLIGAVAYGLAWGGSPVAGVTPASAMYDIGATTAAAPDSIPVTKEAQKRLVADAQVSTEQAADGFQRLPVPLGLSGVNPRQARAFGELIDSRLDLGQAFASGAVAPDDEATAIVPGGNVAAALSYGDFTLAGVGTTTAVCGSDVLNFGHPFFFEGNTSQSMHSADALYIQQDSNAPFKVANPGGVAGTITEDRLAGLKGTLDSGPVTTPVVSTLSNLDSGRERTGVTEAVTPDWTADIAAFHALVNMERVLDSAGGGVARTDLTIKGTTNNGPWSVTIDGVTAERYDLAFLTGFELYEPLYQIMEYPRKEAEITSVTLNGTVTEEYQAINMVSADIRVKGKWQRLNESNLPRVRSDRYIKMRINGYPYKSSTKVRQEFTLPPQPRGFTSVELTGGAEGFYEFDFEGEERTPRTFNRLLRALRDAPSGAQVGVSLYGRKGVNRATVDMPEATTGYTYGEIIVR
ncbi:MAG: hypothetical protein WBG36_08680 [Ornithinimicrobium sp.]